MTAHAFQSDAEHPHFCAVCRHGNRAVEHRGQELSQCPPTVAVRPVIDFGHLVLGQRLSVDGELYEVTAVMA